VEVKRIVRQIEEIFNYLKFFTFKKGVVYEVENQVKYYRHGLTGCGGCLGIGYSYPAGNQNAAKNRGDQRRAAR
jgi:hypothetical protein